MGDIGRQKRQSIVLIVILGSMATFCVGGFALLAVPAIQRTSELSREASKFGGQAVAAITKDWDHQQIYFLASANLRAYEPARINSTLDSMKAHFGKLVRIRSTEVTFIRSKVNNLSSECSATTLSQCEFAKGNGAIKLYIHKEDDGWEVDGIWAPGMTGPSE